MNFKEGSYVGTYQILSLLGAGGMDSPLLVKRKPSLRPR